MSLPPVTSVADLLFKAKTSEAYRRLLIKGVTDFIWSGRDSKTFEEACFALDNYLNSGYVRDCSGVIKYINGCCDLIETEIVMVKNREGEPNLNGRVYLNNPPTTFTFIEPPLEQEDTVVPRTNRPAIIGDNLETLVRHALHPITGEQMTFTHVIPRNASVEYRLLAESELGRIVEHRIGMLRQQAAQAQRFNSIRFYQNGYSA